MAYKGLIVSNFNSNHGKQDQKSTTDDAMLIHMWTRFSPLAKPGNFTYELKLGIGLDKGMR